MNNSSIKPTTPKHKNYNEMGDVFSLQFTRWFHRNLQICFNCFVPN